MKLPHGGDLARAILDFNGVLEQFRDHYGIVACIAGGAPRDALLGRERKDIDVFVLDADSDKLPLLTGDTATAIGEYESPHIRAQWDMLGGVNVVLMKPGIETFRQVVARNDFGVCQVGYTLKDGFFWTPAFEQDATDETFTLYGRARFERSVKRYERLQGKYQGWPLKIVDTAESAS